MNYDDSNKFINYIKNFPCKMIIAFLSSISSYMSYYGEDVILDVRYGKTLPKVKNEGINVHSFGRYSLSATDINSIVFYSVCYSNDYRQSKKELDFVKLVNHYRRYHSANALEFRQNFENDVVLADCFKQAFKRNKLKKEISEKWINQIASWDSEKDKNVKNFIFASSITHTQFLYQDKSWIRDSYNRNYYMLNKLLPSLLEQGSIFGIDKLNKYSLEEVIKECLSMTIDELSALLIFLCNIPMLMVRDWPANIMEVFERLFQMNDILKSEIKVFNIYHLKKILDYYAIDYAEIRNAKDKQNEAVFYSKPFIKTPEGGYYAVNTYLSTMVMSNSMFWIMRDYYGNKYGNTFPDAFGFLFEYYIKELVQHYCPGKCEELKRDQSNKTCDFKITFDDITLLVEAKATLMPLSGKTQNVNQESINKIIEQCALFISAYEQFPFYEKEEDSDKTIKIILLYENILNPYVLEGIIDEFIGKDMPRIVTIGDFEKLLVSWSIDNKNCKKMLEDLLQDYKLSFPSALIKYSFYDKRHYSTYGCGADYFGTIMDTYGLLR